jgi:hypothetical protein
LVSNNYRWGVEIPALHTVSNFQTPSPASIRAGENRKL